MKNFGLFEDNIEETISINIEKRQQKQQKKADKYLIF